MARAFLILHGIENRRPPEHWEHWLADQLRERDELVRYPQLPEPDEPSREDWEATILGELDAIAADDDGEAGGERRVTVVCHSLACPTWLGMGSLVPLRHRASRTLLVAPPDPDVLREIAPGFADLPPKREALHATGPATIVASDADPYNPPGAKAVFGWLEVPIRIVHGAAHFRPEDGYGPWPDVLDWCLDAG